MSGGDVRSDMHLAFSSVALLGVRGGMALGLTMYEAAVATCAVGTAAGVALMHAAALELCASRRRAFVVALAIATAPGVAFFATVFERHGVFFLGAGLAAFAATRFARRPSIATALHLALAMVVGYSLHTTGALLGASYLPLAVAQARRGGCGDGSDGVPWRRVLPLGCLCGVVAAVGALGARRLGVEWGQVGDEGASWRFFLAHAEVHAQRPELLFASLWHELVVPFTPFSLA